jgi:hypothetical protein
VQGFFAFFWKFILKIKYFENHFSILEIDEIFGLNPTRRTHRLLGTYIIKRKEKKDVF